MPQGWDLGVLEVKQFSVGICDGAPLTAHSSCFFVCFFLGFFLPFGRYLQTMPDILLHISI